MLVGTACLSTPLAAQSSWMVGLAATLGGSWQIEGVDVGLTRRAPAGPMRHWGAMVRLGSFINQDDLFGRAQGFVAALTLGVRSGRATILELGDERAGTRVTLDLTLETTGYLASNSPLAVGSAWGALSLLPGVRMGDPGATQFALVFGPTVFVGDTTEVRAFLGIRIESPLARRRPQP